MGTNFDYDDTDHQVIFDNINGGAGSQPLQELSRAWKQLGEDVGVTAKAYIEKAIRGVLASREGAAADAAAAGTGSMLPWMDDAAATAHAASRQVQDQADYWVTARDSVPPVPSAPQSASFFGDPTEWVAERLDWIPGLTTEEEKAAQHRQDAAEQARQAMRVYQSSSNSNLDAAPAFTAPQALHGDVGPGAAGQTGPPGGGTGATAAGGHLASGTGGSGVAGSVPTGTAAAFHTGATPTPRSTNPPRVGAGRPTASPSPTPTQGVTANPRPLLPENPPGAGSARPGDPNLTRGAAGPGGAVIGGDFGGGTRSAGGFGPGGSSRFGPRSGTGAVAAEESATGVRGGASAARGGGPGGYPAPYGAGSGQGGQDRDHQRRYLVESESNAIVGDLPPTAPPVIGADLDD